jgi:hypothetical protein
MKQAVPGTCQRNKQIFLLRGGKQLPDYRQDLLNHSPAFLNEIIQAAEIIFRYHFALPLSLPVYAGLRENAPGIASAQSPKGESN